jgi:hypothetical protein
MQNKENSIRRLTVNLTEEDIQTLKRLAEAKGLTMTDTLRLALQTEAFIQERQQRGEKLLIEKSDGSLREVLFR